MRVLVLGASGMAGHIIATYLTEQGFGVDTLAATHRLNKSTHLLDVTNSQALKDFLTKKHYDAIINSIALLVKPSEKRKDTAVYLNAYLPLFLEHHYQDSTTKVIHISTDGVFSGKKPPYTESSPCDAEDFYGRTKAIGEISNAKDLTIRTSIIGPEIQNPGHSLFDWFMHQKGEITGYNKVFWSGVTTVTLAKAIENALKQNVAGIYHLAPKTNISKYELLQLCKETFNRKDVTIQPSSTTTFDRTLVSTRDDVSFIVPSYQYMVQEMQQWVKEHESLYPHYL